MTSPPPQTLGERPARLSPAYAAAWELYVDWCTTTGHTPVPATSSTLLAFLHDCPAAPATQAVRVRAITPAHTRASRPAPQRTPEILDVLRGRPRRPDPRIPLPPGHLDQLLADLPIHGWTQGWFGRRDRALLVLADTDLTYREIAELTVGDIYLTPTGATINSGDQAIELPAGPDPCNASPAASPCGSRLYRPLPGPPPCGSPAQATVPPRSTLTGRTAAGSPSPSPTADCRCYPPAAPGANSTSNRPRGLAGRSPVSPAAGQPQNRRRHPPPAGATPASPPAPPPTSAPLEPLNPAQAAIRQASVAALAPLIAVLDEVELRAAVLEGRLATLVAECR